jgi:hypothetical protein
MTRSISSHRLCRTYEYPSGHDCQARPRHKGSRAQTRLGVKAVLQMGRIAWLVDQCAGVNRLHQDDRRRSEIQPVLSVVRPCTLAGTRLHTAERQKIDMSAPQDSTENTWAPVPPSATSSHEPSRGTKVYSFSSQYSQRNERPASVMRIRLPGPVSMMLGGCMQVQNTIGSRGCTASV